MSQKRITIIGGGISGLTAAFYLQKYFDTKSDSFEITLIEGSPRLGGIIQTEKRDGFIVENGPDMFVTDKPAALELCEKLGIGRDIIPTREGFRKSFIYSGGKLHQIPEGFCLIAPSKVSALLGLSFMSLKGKLRMAYEYFIPPTKSTADESVASFVTRRFGPEAHEKIAQPMFAGIYTADAAKLSLRATMPKFLDMERDEGSVTRALIKKGTADSKNASGPRYGLFVSFKNGMQTLTDTLAAKLPNVRIMLSTPVTKIKKGNQWQIFLEGGSTLETDIIILAIPAFTASKLIGDIEPELVKELQAIQYESCCTVNMAFKASDFPRPLEGFGFVVPATENRRLIGCTFSNIKFEGRAPEGMVLLRAFIGGVFGRQFPSLSDVEIGRIITQDLQDILNLQGLPKFVSIKRHISSMPQYHVGHLDRVKRIEDGFSAVPNLFYTSNALHGVGIPDSVAQAKKTAEQAIEALKQLIPV